METILIINPMTNIQGIAQNVTTLVEKGASLNDKVNALTGQLGTLTAGAAIEGLAIVILTVIDIYYEKPLRVLNKLTEYP